jgi:hypothetical protein
LQPIDRIPKKKIQEKRITKQELSPKTGSERGKK